MSGGCKYIYCIAKMGEEMTFNLTGIGNEGDGVRTIAYRNIAAIVSDSPHDQYTALPKDILLRHLVAHQSVVEEVMKEFSIIPVKFGTVVQDDSGVREVLKKGYQQVTRTMEAVEGKIEIDVVAFWKDLLSVLQEIGQKEEIIEFKEAASRKPTDQFMDAKIALGQMVKAALDRKRESYASEILLALRIEAEDVCSNDLLDETMIMNVAFLLDRRKERDFDQALRSLNVRYREAVDFRCVGPLPPYSFSTIEIDEVGVESIDTARRELELGQEASLEEIKEAHRRLIRRYHPDRNSESPDTTEKFQKVSEAYQVLTEYAQHYKYPFHRDEYQGFISVRVLKLSEMQSMGKVSSVKPLHGR